MSSVGPELPPHLLAKRKREAEADAQAGPHDAARGPKKARSRSSGPDDEKPRRVIGPAPPPAPLDEKPPGDAENETDSSDDEVGPALPSGPLHIKNDSMPTQQASVFDDAAYQETFKAAKPQRDEWMTLLPSGDDWSARVDPTKLRNRKFNTGKGARAPQDKSGGVGSIWTETPEQKRQRLENEVMGVEKPASQGGSKSSDNATSAEEREAAQRIQEYNTKYRNKSLYDTHSKSATKEEEDDPSKRAFDREKDIAGGQKIGFAQKKEMLNRAKDFGSRFSGGRYL